MGDTLTSGVTSENGKTCWETLEGEMIFGTTLEGGVTCEVTLESGTTSGLTSGVGVMACRETLWG